MEELTTNVSWTAVIVGFVAAYAVGFLWYGVIFQKAWALGNGLPEKPEKFPVMAMVLQLAGTFLYSWVFGITAAREMLATVILIVLTITCLIAAGALYRLRPPGVAMIDAGYILAMGIVLFICQAIF
ncbi:MAG: DUF1761 domain-containing protein [Rhizobiaceae bacterium]|nr:DUF1761 domain-containing protein [Rhizobiaceae bacterium]